MELVYLWVENYKNIKKQGFNFSSRFKCKFYNEYETDKNGKEKLKDNCKLEIKSKEYTNIFPPNINITAIVGENGSGKSNLLDVLSDYISNDKLTIKVFYDGTKFLYKTNKPIIINTTAIKQDISEVTVLYTEIPSSNSIDNQNITNISLWNQLQESDYEISENLNLIKNKMQTSHMILMRKYGFLPGINKKPQYIEFSFNHYYFGDIEHSNIEQIWISIFKILVARDSDKYIDGIAVDEFLAYDYEDLTVSEIKQFIKDNITDEDTLSWLKELQDLLKKFMLNYKKISNSKVEYVHQTISNTNIKDDFNEDNEHKTMKTFKLFIPFEDFSEIFLLSIENLFSYSREELIVTLRWDITLSTGEESFLNLFASLYNCIKRYSYSLEHINIIVDEIEAYLHPNWQKQFIDLIIKFFSLKGIKYNSKTNIILTSHSPFILSDLPKEHVIFLEKGVQKHPFKDTEQTFGANIHTLLSHGFFMKDGLMGEFAKEKINQVYNFIVQKDTKFIKTKEEAQNIINLIGEPLIKKQLQKLFDETFDKNNLTLDDEIKLLEKKLNALKELKNDKN